MSGWRGSEGWGQFSDEQCTPSFPHDDPFILWCVCGGGVGRLGWFGGGQHLRSHCFKVSLQMRHHHRLGRLPQTQNDTKFGPPGRLIDGLLEAER